jgi:hypothetical protein
MMIKSKQDIYVLIQTDDVPDYLQEEYARANLRTRKRHKTLS